MEKQSKDYSQVLGMVMKAKTKRLLKGAVAVLALAVVAIYFLIPSIAKAMLVRSMESRGWSTSIESVEVTKNGLTAKNIHVVSRDGRKNADLIRVEISVNMRFRPTLIIANGGRISVSSGMGTGATKEHTARETEIRMKEVAIDWNDENSTSVKSQSASVDIASDGTVKLSMDKMEAKMEGHVAEATGVMATIGEKGAQMSAETLTTLFAGKKVLLSKIDISNMLVRHGHVSFATKIAVASMEDLGTIHDLAADIDLPNLKNKPVTVQLSMSAKSFSGYHGAISREEVFTNPMRMHGTVLISSKNDWSTKLAMDSNGVVANVEWSMSQKEWSMSINVDQTPCKSIFDAIPDAMKRKLAGMEISGTIKGSAQISNGLETKVFLELANACKVDRVPEQVQLALSGKPFKRTTYSASGKPKEVDTPLGAGGWTPLTSISPYMAKAVVTTEDPGFWGHGGIDIEAIRNSMRDNIREGRFTRGASTIPMQLSKNLFLNREKTASRKVQEFFLTLAISQRLTKEKILEMYLNIVEFGPDLYGIGQASRHYFGIDPRNISLAQAVFLASILPKPRAQYFETDGKINRMKQSHVGLILDLMLKRGSITEEECRAAKEEQLTMFGKSSAYQGMDTSEWTTE